MQSALSGSKQVGLFPCRGSVVPCRTLSLVSATYRGTVKPGVCQTCRIPSKTWPRTRDPLPGCHNRLLLWTKASMFDLKNCFKVHAVCSLSARLPALVRDYSLFTSEQKQWLVRGTSRALSLSAASLCQLESDRPFGTQGQENRGAYGLARNECQPALEHRA